MSKSMVRLLPCQLRAKPFKHPLLRGKLTPLTEGVIAALLEDVYRGSKTARDKLILGHLSMLRNTVGRYLYHWPITGRFTEEMVSVGLLTLTRKVNDLTEEILQDAPLGSYLLNHICKHVEIEIATLRGVAPAPMRTNQRRMEHGREPIYGEVEGDIRHEAFQEGCCYIEPGFEELDTLDVVSQLEAESDKCKLLLSPECWGLNDTEASEKTGIPRQTVQWYRIEMLKRYRKLTGAN